MGYLVPRITHGPSPRFKSRSRRNPGSPKKLLKAYLRAVDAWYDMRMSKKAVAAVARKAIAAGCDRNRMDDLPQFLGRGAWGGES